MAFDDSVAAKMWFYLWSGENIIKSSLITKTVSLITKTVE